MKQKSRMAALVTAGVATIALGGLTMMLPSAARADSDDYGHYHHFDRDRHYDSHRAYWSNDYYYDGYGHRYDRDEYNRRYGREHRYNDRNNRYDQNYRYHREWR